MWSGEMAQPIRGTIRQQRRRQVAAALPDVKAVIDKHGRKIVSICLYRLTRYAKQYAEIDALKKRVAALEKGVG
jgi:hypothetical protein